jgi:hypothetical protein
MPSTPPRRPPAGRGGQDVGQAWAGGDEGRPDLLDRFEADGDAQQVGIESRGTQARPALLRRDFFEMREPEERRG